MRMTVLAVLMAATPHTRATINRALRPDDFEVVWAANASEAMEVSAQRRPDLVLLDLNQPVHRAWRDFESLRAANPDAPVVLLLERGTAHDRSVGDKTVAVVQKPVGPAALADAVNGLLNSPESVTASVSQEADLFGGPNTEAGKLWESLLARRDTPLALPPLNRYWGINE